MLLSSSVAKPVAPVAVGLAETAILGFLGDGMLLSTTLRLAQRPQPADGACCEAVCSPTTGCRTRRLQCLDLLLVNHLQQSRAAEPTLLVEASGGADEVCAGMGTTARQRGTGVCVCVCVCVYVYVCSEVCVFVCVKKQHQEQRQTTTTSTRVDSIHRPSPLFPHAHRLPHPPPPVPYKLHCAPSAPSVPVVYMDAYVWECAYVCACVCVRVA